MEDFTRNLGKEVLDLIHRLDRDYRDERGRLANSARALGIDPPAAPTRGPGRPRGSNGDKPAKARRTRRTAAKGASK